MRLTRRLDSPYDALEEVDDVYPRSEPGAGDRPQPRRPPSGPAHHSATIARRQPAGRNRLQAPAAYRDDVQRPSRKAAAFAVEGIPSEPMARSTEIGCSPKGIDPKASGVVGACAPE